MSRYSSIPLVKTETNTPRRYINVKYPNIVRSQNDVYVYVSQGDRYDILAQKYYQDVDLWWVISRANPTHPFDSLFPTPGLQLRIPSPDRIPEILSNFENLNK